jgi:hypothetical protein
LARRALLPVHSIESEVEKPMQKKIAKQYAGKKTDKEIAEM